MPVADFLTKNAGLFLIILLVICSIVALAIFLERFFYLKKTEKDNASFFKQLFEMMNNNQTPEALHYCEDSKNVICANIVKDVLKRPDRKRPQLKESIEEAANRETPKLETKIPALGTIASIAPLLGLLGTVLGMIDSLKTLQTSLDLGGAQNTSGLLNGIWTALRTTAAGLIVAIPALTGYNYLVNKVGNLIVFIRNRSNEVIELISSNQKDS